MDGVSNANSDGREIIKLTHSRPKPSSPEDCGMSPVSQLAFVCAFAFILGTLFSFGTSAQDWLNLPEKPQVVTVEGQRINIVVRPEARFSDGESGGIVLNLRARVRLDDLQTKAPDILRALAAKKTSCQRRWSFPQLSPATVHGGRLRIGGQVRVEQWICTSFLKTYVARESAHFIVALHPVQRENEVTVAADLEKFDLGKSILPGVRDELKQVLSSALSKVFDSEGMKFKFPPEIASINPRFTDTHLADAGDGKGEFHIEADAVIRAADMAKIMTLITK